MRSDQTRPPCMWQRLTILDREPQRRRVTGGENSTVRRTGRTTGIDMPADTRGLGLGDATIGVPRSYCLHCEQLITEAMGCRDKTESL